MLSKISKISDEEYGKKMTLVHYENGDVLVSIDGTGSFECNNSVKFCTKVNGGNSSNTLRVLRKLIDAMEKDKLEYGKVKGSIGEASWEPESGDKYWYWSFDKNKPKEVKNKRSELDYTLIYSGNCFRHKKTCMKWAKINKLTD